MKQLIRFSLTIAPVIAVVLAICELVVSNQFVGSGKEIRTVDTSIDVIRSENAKLEQQVASASSLLTISAKAKEIGFVEPKPSQYLTIAPSQLPVAFNLKQ